MASLDDFFVSTYIPTAVEIERANRIRLAVYAYAYEYESTSLISDGEFDELSKKIDLTISTGNSKIDKWFKKNFEPDTGMWIRKHPELDKVKALCYQYINGFDSCYRVGNVVYEKIKA
jgi:hypothetical protein